VGQMKSLSTLTSAQIQAIATALQGTTGGGGGESEDGGKRGGTGGRGGGD
jgi:hypothetical protein